MDEPITIFISYAHKDASFLQELQTRLRPYEREKIVSVWTDKDIVAGNRWDDLIKTKLNKSEVILFLVSPDFLASDYINDKEIEAVLKKEPPLAVPIIIRPSDLNMLKINHLQAIPTGAKSIAEWENRDTAWQDVINGLKSVFIQVKPTLSHLLAGLDVSQSQKRTSAKWETTSFTDALMKILSLLLVVICMIALVYGLLKRDSFYSFTSLAGMASGSVGYMFFRKH